MELNCTTDDPNATVSLLQQVYSNPYTERPVTPGKIILKEQTFTVLDLARQDGGNYKCKARDKSGHTIESSQVFLLIDRGTLI